MTGCEVTGAFQVEAIMRDSLIVGYTDCLEYIENHDIKPGGEQMLLAGRALTDLNAADTLYTKNGQAVNIAEFHMYGRKIDFCGRCCTCVMVCTYSSDIIAGDILQKIT